MTNEELNTRLYEKMFAEQEQFRDWLLSQPPAEILNHAYEYTMREDILMSLEYNDLEDSQARALLKSGKPLKQIFERWEDKETSHMENIWDNIMNFDLFNRVVKYIVENVGKTFSANAIAKFLKSEGRSLSVEAVYNYLNWLEKAFVIYRCQRYDLQGKSVLKTQEKFYLADASLKYCIMGFNPKSIAAMLENIVYFELRRRGYEVYIGKNETKEIDFVAVQRDERIYVQVCRRLPEESDREVANLLEIKDHYPKYVVTLDELAAGNINGVKIVHLADFLLSDTY